jgi:hypothetical protein
VIYRLTGITNSTDGSTPLLGEISPGAAAPEAAASRDRLQNLPVPGKWL